ncbi:hypothetical protein MTR_1g102580 [Medicago truncatula]|uniref:Uncharacterized protein n=1 Tax=Medicago truncatula TaxID=3880 RepID=A0A072VPN1_MEDTR|nr:hypothetical protein MTR_1g102580 [Medicago truncatula]
MFLSRSAGVIMKPILLVGMDQSSNLDAIANDQQIPIAACAVSKKMSWRLNNHEIPKANFKIETEIKAPKS